MSSRTEHLKADRTPPDKVLPGARILVGGGNQLERPMEAKLRHRSTDLTWLVAIVALVTLGSAMVDRHKAQTSGSINRIVKNYQGAPSKPPEATKKGRHK